MGIRDDNLSLNSYKWTPELILDKVKTRICQKEAVKHQQHILRGNTDTHVVSDLKEVKQTRSKRPSGTKSHKNDSTPGTSKKCTRCDKTKHPCDKFPAQEAECFKGCRRVMKPCKCCLTNHMHILKLLVVILRI